MRSRVMRAGRASAGIQLAPLQKMSMPLTRKNSEVPTASGCVDDLELAQADPPLHPVAGDRHHRLVQRLRTVTGRPPQRRLVEIDRQRCLGAGAGDGDIGRSGRPAEGEDDRDRPLLDRGDLDLGGDRHLAVVMVLLADDGVLDADAVEEMELRLGIDAEHHQAGPPVPAGMALHLADHVHVGDAIVARERDRERLASGQRVRLLCRRDETEHDLVLAGADDVADVEAMTDERGGDRARRRSR